MCSTKYFHIPSLNNAFYPWFRGRSSEDLNTEFYVKKNIFHTSLHLLMLSSVCNHNKFTRHSYFQKKIWKLIIVYGGEFSLWRLIRTGIGLDPPTSWIRWPIHPSIHSCWRFSTYFGFWIRSKLHLCSFLLAVDRHFLSKHPGFDDQFSLSLTPPQ